MHSIISIFLLANEATIGSCHGILRRVFTWEARIRLVYVFALVNCLAWYWGFTEPLVNKLERGFLLLHGMVMGFYSFPPVGLEDFAYGVNPFPTDEGIN